MTFIPRFKTLGFSVIGNKYENLGNKFVNYIGLKATQPLSDEQWAFAGRCQNRLVKISNDKEWAINAEIFGSVISIFSLPYPFAFLYGFLYPRHKEYYEKLIHIKETIEKEKS
jgi:hypothetical protein